MVNPPEDIVLQVTELSVSFKDSNGNSYFGVNSLSFNLQRGKVLALIGESGSGKSLTALALIGLLPHDAAMSSKEITLYSNGTEMELTNQKEDFFQKEIRGKKIGMIFQDPTMSLNPIQKIQKQLLESIKLNPLYSKTNKETLNSVISEILAKVNLLDIKRILNSYPHQLSGGEKQRIIIASCLLLGSEIIIADEPSSSLDFNNQQEILNLLKSIQLQFGISIILISHDIELVAKIADDILILKEGKLMEYGRIKEVLSNPSNPYSISLLECKPNRNAKLKRLPTIDYFYDNPFNLSFLELKEKFFQNYQISERQSFLENEIVLYVSGLYFRYDKSGFFGFNNNENYLFKNLNFNLHKGEILGILGKSGSGKSTLAKLIIHLLTNYKGEIITLNKNWKLLNTQDIKIERREIQLIFQNPYESLNPRITIGKSILELLIFHKIEMSNKKSNQRVLELFQMVGLNPNLIDRYPNELSGGERQRVAIAKAIALEPKILICDECTSSLDVSIQAQILNLLKDLQEKMDLSIIFISHNEDVLQHISNRILKLENGILKDLNLELNNF